MLVPGSKFDVKEFSLVVRGDFAAKSEDDDRCSATLCFKSVSFHSCPRDETVLAVDLVFPLLTALLL